MSRIATFLLLALVLGAAYASHAAGLLWAIGGVGTHVGASFAFMLALVFATAAAGSAFARWRLPIVLGSSILHLAVVYGSVKTAISLAIWIAFYFLVRLRVTWWLKIVPVLALYAAPFLLAVFDPTSILIGALTVAFCATNFTLRSVLFAYEAATKREQLEATGLAGYLLCLAATPLTLVNFAPIGFLVLLRGLKTRDEPAMIRRGVGEIALGVTYLTALHAGSQVGLLPVYKNVVTAAESLDVLSALAAALMLLLRFFLKVAGDIHLAVGMLRVLGFDIPSGSERPLLSPNVLEFWRRWNTYYRDYLLTLGYYPVASAFKRRPLLAVAAGGATAFLLSGFAHVVQFVVRHPTQLTLRIFLEAHVWALVFGAFVIVWMIREVKRSRLPRERVARAAGPGSWSGLRDAGRVAVTLATVSVILLTYYPPLTGAALSTLGGILKAFLRLPG